MPQFNITATFSLVTEVEPDGLTFNIEADDVEDNSHFGSESVTSYGGEVTFTVTAENEDDAYGEAERLFPSGDEVTDYNGLTWLTEDVNYDVEAVEVEMTLQSAIDLVTEAIAESDLGSETQEALRFLLALIPRQ